jgi:hypothetical protein
MLHEAGLDRQGVVATLERCCALFPSQMDAVA